MAALKRIFDHFRRPTFVLKVEKEEMQVMAPASSLLTLGHSLVLNFFVDRVEAHRMSTTSLVNLIHQYSRLRLDIQLEIDGFSIPPPYLRDRLAEVERALLDLEVQRRDRQKMYDDLVGGVSSFVASQQQHQPPMHALPQRIPGSPSSTSLASLATPTSPIAPVSSEAYYSGLGGSASGATSTPASAAPIVHGMTRNSSSTNMSAYRSSSRSGATSAGFDAESMSDNESEFFDAVEDLDMNKCVVRAGGDQGMVIEQIPSPMILHSADPMSGLSEPVERSRRGTTSGAPPSQPRSISEHGEELDTDSPFASPSNTQPSAVHLRDSLVTLNNEEHPSPTVLADSFTHDSATLSPETDLHDPALSKQQQHQHHQQPHDDAMSTTSQRHDQDMAVYPHPRTRSDVSFSGSFATINSAGPEPFPAVSSSPSPSSGTGESRRTDSMISSHGAWRSPGDALYHLTGAYKTTASDSGSVHLDGVSVTHANYPGHAVLVHSDNTSAGGDSTNLSSGHGGGSHRSDATPAHPAHSALSPPTKRSSRAIVTSSLLSFADHVYSRSKTKPGSGLLEFRARYSFAKHLVFALLKGRPVVVIGKNENEGSVRNIVTALSLFVAGPSNKQVIPWILRPLALSDLARCKLVGMSKQYSLPKAVERYVSVFDFENETARTPTYQGTFIDIMLSKNRLFKDEDAFLASVHCSLLEMASKAFFFYHLYCLSAGDRSAQTGAGSAKLPQLGGTSRASLSSSSSSSTGSVRRGSVGQANRAGGNLHAIPGHVTSTSAYASQPATPTVSSTQYAGPAAWQGSNPAMRSQSSAPNLPALQQQQQQQQLAHSSRYYPPPSASAAYGGVSGAVTPFSPSPRSPVPASPNAFSMASFSNVSVFNSMSLPSSTAPSATSSLTGNWANSNSVRSRRVSVDVMNELDVPAGDAEIIEFFAEFIKLQQASEFHKRAAAPGSFVDTPAPVLRLDYSKCVVIKNVFARRSIKDGNP
ncbi:hypothetical protein, variant [Capsaspora owczarzaki ATCC 30864]|nr:hypothetical protein, variant [Capsaspora owczarzaki ATCC 30864]